ncbi:Helix-turn-helix domain protein [Jeotgalicoccus saudimassiliensis]|uniref:Helix-turn-helix domain protein n=1 Tax=Jeotgalicoccus saudimassiliensis TaxID=1461582 RepID=A0A078M058_9STAP|nr:helix-turn-helix domain-containing protein [Jeotgalicoccus saudimassiliensis]CDZ99605.1 Helix-turn-helix domain protein [Jeotgalicoccus saudimassiliensis]
MKLGTYLQNKREKSGVTLKEMEHGSGIKRSVIQIIEAGDLTLLPEPRHTRFLIRKYADFLNLDAEQLLERFEDEIPDTSGGNQKRNQKSNQDFQYLKKVLLGFITMIVVLFAVWLVLLQIGSQGDIFETKRVYETDERVTKSVADNESDDEASNEDEAAEEEQSAEGESEEKAETEEEAAEEAPKQPSAEVNFVNREGNTLNYNITAPEDLTIELSGDETSWVSMTDDLDNSYLYEESDGGSFDIDPDAKIVNLALGNSTTFDISVNGTAIDNSQRGDTVTVYYQFNITRE